MRWMNRLACVMVLWLAVGCGGGNRSGVAGTYTPGDSVASVSFSREAAAPSAAQATSEVPTERMLVWTSYLTLKVGDVAKAERQATAIVEQAGGYVQSTSGNDEKRASLTLRVKADKLQDSIGALEKLGKVESRDVSSDDVTEQYVDVEARLKNKYVLRDRLTALLDRADKVTDVLAIEAELNRVQSDIDSMEAQIKSLKGRVAEATIYLTLERKRILGPLGHFFSGLYWVVEKAFVIRG